VQSHLYGKAAIGENPTFIYGGFQMANTGQLYLLGNTEQTPTLSLFIIGQYTSLEGSEIYMNITPEYNTTNTALNIIGSAEGKTKLVLNLYNQWEGQRIDLARAENYNTEGETFYVDEEVINGFQVQLLFRIEGGDIIWYIEGNQTHDNCENLIVQKKNHTLECNNNPATNGGYQFVYYKWYKNDILIHQGAYGEDKGGYYYAGKNNNLDFNAVYTVVATDQYGVDHYACPFTPVYYDIPEHIIVFPNPVYHDNAVVVVDVLTNDDELLTNGVLTFYNAIGQYLGTKRTEGHRYTTINLPDISGTYFIRFVSGDFEKTLKVIVQ